MSGKKSRDKGARRERELLKLLRDAGVLSKKVPLSGACDGFKGDLLVGHRSSGFRRPSRWEVKTLKNGFKFLYTHLENNRVLALKADGKDWLLCMRLQDWLEER